ncbi:MAG: alpha/beta hydrolase [Flavobacteriales bacterium]|nr:alpha/beta hydrolase [Flavobacteriales bacterium]
MHTVYFVSGLGAKCSIFDKIKLPENHQKQYLEWIVPKKNESIENYAKRLSESITEEDFSLIGLSFGGIIIQEISKFKKPKRLILVSSIARHKELSGILNIIKKSRVYKLTPKFVFKSNGMLTFLFFRKIYSRKLPNIKEFLLKIDSYYYTWSINRIMNWKENHLNIPIYRIHGNNDVVFPITKNSSIDYVVDGGSHVMVLNKYIEISEYIEKIIKN